MPDGNQIAQVTFTLNGKDVTVPEGWTIWEAANGRGLTIPHLCHKPDPGYRPDGNCRACMVEVEGSGRWLLPAFATRAEGMVVTPDSTRADQRAQDGDRNAGRRSAAALGRA